MITVDLMNFFKISTKYMQPIFLKKMWLSFIIMWWSPDSKSFMLLSRSFSFFFTTTKTSNSTMPLIRGPKVTCGSYYEKFNFCSCKCFPCFVAKGFFFTSKFAEGALLLSCCKCEQKWHCFVGMHSEAFLIKGLVSWKLKWNFYYKKRVKIATTPHTTFLRE